MYVCTTLECRKFLQKAVVYRLASPLSINFPLRNSLIYVHYLFFSPGEGHKLKGLMVLDNKIVTASSSGVVSLFDDAISLEDEAAEPLASFDVIKQSLKQSGRLKKGSYATGSAEEIEHVARLRSGN